jgi:transcriptional regulator of acetoin/glycerol metabolism
MPSILDEIIRKLRKVPLSELPAVLETIEAAATRKKTRRGGGALVQHLARQAVEADIAGSKLDEVERAIVAHAYETTGGNVSAAARILGIDRKAMERRLVLYGIGRHGGH